MKNSILQSSRKFVQIRLHRDFTAETAEIAGVDVSQNLITLGERDWLRTGAITEPQNNGPSARPFYDHPKESLNTPIEVL